MKCRPKEGDISPLSHLMVKGSVDVSKFQIKNSMAWNY